MYNYCGDRIDSYSILIFVNSLFGCPLPWLPGAATPFALPLYATAYESFFKHVRQTWAICSLLVRPSQRERFWTCVYRCLVTDFHQLSFFT